MEFQRLFPDPGRTELPQAMQELRAATAPDDRPHVLANFVASVDGRATFHGRSGQLGDEGDRAVFTALRDVVDAVLVGTTTLRIERYGRMIRDPERRLRRQQHGLAPEPIACVISRSGNVPTDIPLFSEPNSKVVLITAKPPDTSTVAADCALVRIGPAELTLTGALRVLRQDFGIRVLLCEGGPRLFGGLLRERLVDELFLTLAPKLVGGGDGPAITGGPELGELQQLRLRWLLERGDSLYLRYALQNGG
jgi:riboflavin-specific deaminase-like protein